MKHHALTKDTRNGEYYCRIQIRGISKRILLGTKEQREADKQLWKIEQDIATGKYPFFDQQTSLVITKDGLHDMRIEELVVRHLDWVKANRTEGTFNNRKFFANQFLEFLQGYMPQGSCMVSQITRPTLSDFHTWARKHHGRGENGGNEALVSVKAMFNWAVKEEVCDHNIKSFPPITRLPPETRRFSLEDLKKLLPILPDDFKDMVEFGLLTGLRPEELMGLKKLYIKTDADERKNICIEHHKTSRTARIHKPRSIPLCKRAEEIIARQCQLHPKSDYVFLNTDGLPYTRSAFFHRLQRWCKKAKIHGMPYSLRHTFGTTQGECKTNQAVISQVMGHTSLQTTARYIGNNTQSHIQAVDYLQKRLESVLSSAPSDAETPPKLSPKLSRSRETPLKISSKNVCK